MIRVLLLVLLLSGCSDDGFTSLDDAPKSILSNGVEYRLVEDAVQVVYIDENCLKPAVKYDYKLAYDSEYIYLKDHNSTQFYTDGYYIKDGLLCAYQLAPTNLHSALQTYYKDTMLYVNGYLYTSLKDGYHYL